MDSLGADALLCYMEPEGRSVLWKWGAVLPAVKEFQEAGYPLRKRGILKVHDFKSL